MAVLAIQSVKACKLCSHAERLAIDALLEKRSRRETDSDGNNINLEYVLRTLGEWGVRNPTEENVKNHWKKHCEMIDEAEAATNAAEASVLTEAQLKVARRVLGDAVLAGDETATPEQLLELQRALFPLEVVDRIRAGRPLGITWDQLDRGINTQTRRAQEEKADELVRMLAAASGTAIAAQGRAIEALASGSPVEGEAIEDAEVVGELPAGG